MLCDFHDTRALNYTLSCRKHIIENAKYMFGKFIIFYHIISSSFVAYIFNGNGCSELVLDKSTITAVDIHKLIVIQ